MLVVDGIISMVGPTSEIAPIIPQDCEVIDAHGKAVLPGFVDAHTHPVFGGTRVDEFEMRCRGASYEEIAQAGGGIRSTVAKTRAASEEELVESGKRYSEWFLNCGTTTVEAKSGYGLDLETEIKMLRAIRHLNEHTCLRYVPTFLGAHAVPEEFKGRPSTYLNTVVADMLPEIANLGLAEYCDVFCEKGYFSPEDAKLVLESAKHYGLKPRIHADQLSDSGGAKVASEVGAVTADHLEQTSSEGIRALAKANVQPVLLPGSVHALGKSKYPASREMIEAGLAIVLATDFNPGSSPTPSMPMVLSLACTQMHMTAAEAITASTINAAYSLGLGSSLGSLEKGKIADFVIWDTSDHREIAYFFGVNLVAATFTAGKLQPSGRVLINI